MKKILRSSFTFKNILISFILSFEITLILDFICTFLFSLKLRVFYYPIALVVLFFALIFLPFHRFRIRIIVSITLPLVLLISAVLPYAVYSSFKNDSAYMNVPCTSVDFFSDKKVMVVVPHEDDDLNLTSGIIENYVKCGSEIYPVFVTNGDYFGLGEERIEEAIKCWKYIGVPESNVSFLGYGDGWNEKDVHIYNAEADKPLISHIGNRETYGISTHLSYHEGNVYTNRNYRNDLKNLLLFIKPDTIFVSDYDAHSDHIAVSLVFEQVMGEILKETESYKPIVYKGFAYSTAWKAPEDFYFINAFSSKEPEGFMIYDWEDRVRIPVSTSSLSRSVFSTSTYQELSVYDSQKANSHATRIVNSDKVFWQRRTDSLLNQASIWTSSGNKALLNDFRILDNNNVNDLEHDPYDGVWVPSNDDTEKKIRITMNKSVDVSQIVLYDHPSAENNITNIKISFDDGTSLKTGELNKNGTATVIKTDKKGIKQFTIEVLSGEGSKYGLSEIEAFGSAKQETDTFIKLVDDNMNFIYDYITDEECVLSLYSNNYNIADLTEENYTLSCDNNKCICKIKENKLYVKCPYNECATITVKEKSSNLYDTVIIRNPSLLKKAKLAFGQYLEDNYVFSKDENGHRYERNVYQDVLHNLTIYRLFGYIKAKVF